MLRGIHKATANWLGRIITAVLLGMIAVSFAIWGVGDVFRGFGRSYVAKIGGTEIGIEQFRQVYNDRLQQISRQINRPIGADQARLLGLDRQILGQLLAETALDTEARRLRLGLSDTDVGKQIANDVNFRGPSGQFDRTRFDFIVRQLGYTEARYVAEQKRLSLRRQIVDPVTSKLPVPAAALDVQNRYQNEQRAIDYLQLGTEQAGPIEDPAPEVLAQYFEQNKTRFRAPETRKIEYLALSPVTLAPWIEVSDADVQKMYDERKATYTTPERREIQQIVFPNMDEARAASERLKNGLSFSDLIAERKLKESDVNLGLVPKSTIVDPAVADAAFKLAAESISEPIAGRFGAVLVRVGKIEPEKVRPLSEVAPEIKRDIARDRARKQVADQYEKVEDERGASIPLAEIAKKLQLQTKTIESIDRSGRNADDAPVTDLPPGVDLISAAFASDVGVENEALKDASGGYVWFDVLDIKPARERTLDEVKDRVVESWKQDEIAARLKTKAAALTESLKTKSIADVAAEAGLQVQSASGLKRNTPSQGLTRNVIDDVFKLAKDGVGDSEGDRATQRYVFKLKDIAVPQFDAASEQNKQAADQLRSTYADELLAQYVAQLEKDLGTTIDENALNQVVGGSVN